MKLDTQFTGGVILRYTYTGKADTGQIQKEVEDIVDRSVSVQTSENSATGEKSLVITLSGKKRVDARTAERDSKYHQSGK